MKKENKEKFSKLGCAIVIIVFPIIFCWNSLKSGLKILKSDRRFIIAGLIAFTSVILFNGFVLTNHPILKSLLFYTSIPMYICSLGLISTIKDLLSNKKSKEAKEIATLLDRFDWISVVDVEDRGDRKNILIHSKINLDAIIKQKAILEHALNTNIINVKNAKGKDIIVFETMAILTDSTKRLIEIRNIIGDQTIDIFASDNTADKSTDYYSSKTYLDGWKAKEKQLSFFYKVEHIEISYTKQNNIKIIAYKNTLKTIEWSESLYIAEKGIFKIGESLKGSVFMNFNHTANVLIGGEPGGGKSVLLQLFGVLALKQGAKIIIGDFKGLDFWDFEGLAEIVTEHDELLRVLKRCYKEHKRRKAIFRVVLQKNQ